ncbi:hypothetical protein [Micromonospora sp. NBC_01813]|uniref:hypothetical protein n=1 Tax=Micromonospora sp. NBC_01813 TaxID=2975988 RepID=UPI002DDC393E|nr:hypothetical protein [Micromonospora sp. NBC_01813]WSA06928.1 hypothetical protein OG958_22020 [Micromonospora sp. NBC_01813]
MADQPALGGRGGRRRTGRVAGVSAWLLVRWWSRPGRRAVDCGWARWTGVVEQALESCPQLWEIVVPDEVEVILPRIFGDCVLCDYQGGQECPSRGTEGSAYLEVSVVLLVVGLGWVAVCGVLSSDVVDFRVVALLANDALATVGDRLPELALTRWQQVRIRQQ